jgi:hypothetical protein
MNGQREACGTQRGFRVSRVPSPRPEIRDRAFHNDALTALRSQGPSVPVRGQITRQTCRVISLVTRSKQRKVTHITRHKTRQGSQCRPPFVLADEPGRSVSGARTSSREVPPNWMPILVLRRTVGGCQHGTMDAC